MNTNQPTPCTQNDTWGFWGTMEDQASIAWPMAMHAISDACHQPLESVRIFLDSVHGRHFADDVQNEIVRGLPLEDAINAATQRWMGWTIGHQTSKQHGIPRGMPYLTGFVMHLDIAEEMQAS